MKKTTLKKCSSSFVLFVALAGLLLIMPSCQAGGGSGEQATLLDFFITPWSISIPQGKTVQFYVGGYYSDSPGGKRMVTEPITWSSSDVTVATVDNSGLVTSIQAGTTHIVATLNDGRSRYAILTVTPAALTSIAITPANPSIAPGATTQYAATGLISDGTTQNLTAQASWKSSNTGVVTIDSTGFATAIAVGSATITATLGNTSGTATLTVTPAGSLSGSLDNTFGTQGTVVTSASTVTDCEEAASAIAIQGNGKIVAAGPGCMPLGNSFTSAIALVRYNEDGSLDSTFGNNGKVITTAGTYNSANALAIQGDGKIVVGGYALLRYNVDGSLDTSFGSGGIAMLAAGNDVEATAVAIQADGKILISGSKWNIGHYDVTLLRYNSNGTPDSIFGINGIATTGIINSGFDAKVTDMKIQGDGKVVVAGSSADPLYYSGYNNYFAIARFNADGSLDNTFGTGGTLISEVTVSSVSSVAIQGNGKILASGSATINYGSELVLVRFNGDGSLDSAFGTGGIVTTVLGGSYHRTSAVAIQSDEKIVVAGSSYNGANDDFILVRYNPDGSLDSAFAGGKVTTVIGTGFDEASDLAIQSDGKIVVAGHTWNGSGYDFAVVRYMP